MRLIYELLVKLRLWVSIHIVGTDEVYYISKRKFKDYLREQFGDDYMG